MIKIDTSVIVQMVNFIFLILVLNMVLFKPVRKILRQRKEKVDGLEENIESFQKDAQEKDASYLSGIKEARLRGLEEKEKLLQSAADEEKRIIARINEKAQADLEAVRKKVAEDAEKVSTALKGEIDSFAQAIKEKILGRAV